MDGYRIWFAWYLPGYWIFKSARYLAGYLDNCEQLHSANLIFKMLTLIPRKLNLDPFVKIFWNFTWRPVAKQNIQLDIRYLALVSLTGYLVSALARMLTGYPLSNPISFIKLRRQYPTGKLVSCQIAGYPTKSVSSTALI
jgi:hypothetical protein